MAIDMDYIGGTTAHVLRCDHCEAKHPVAFPTAGSAWNHAKRYWDCALNGMTYHPECADAKFAWIDDLLKGDDTNG